nr:hypothetical protein CFP56_46760 [Quercus suber]
MQHFGAAVSQYHTSARLRSPILQRSETGAILLLPSAAWSRQSWTSEGAVWRVALPSKQAHAMILVICRRYITRQSKADGTYCWLRNPDLRNFSTRGYDLWGRLLLSCTTMLCSDVLTRFLTVERVLPSALQDVIMSHLRRMLLCSASLGLLRWILAVMLHPRGSSPPAICWPLLARGSWSGNRATTSCHNIGECIRDIRSVDYRIGANTLAAGSDDVILRLNIRHSDLLRLRGRNLSAHDDCAVLYDSGWDRGYLDNGCDTMSRVGDRYPRDDCLLRI